jgi:hypothetical protein
MSVDNPVPALQPGSVWRVNAYKLSQLLPGAAEYWPVQGTVIMGDVLYVIAVIQGKNEHWYAYIMQQKPDRTYAFGWVAEVWVRSPYCERLM